jgi:hypothetical protein
MAFKAGVTRWPPATRVGLIEVIKSFTPIVAEHAGVRDPAGFLPDKPLSALDAAPRQSLRSDGLAGVALPTEAPAQDNNCRATIKR